MSRKLVFSSRKSSSNASMQRVRESRAGFTDHNSSDEQETDTSVSSTYLNIYRLEPRKKYTVVNKKVLYPHNSHEQPGGDAPKSLHTDSCRAGQQNALCHMIPKLPWELVGLQLFQTMLPSQFETQMRNAAQWKCTKWLGRVVYWFDSQHFGDRLYLLAWPALQP